MTNTRRQVPRAGKQPAAEPARAAGRKTRRSAAPPRRHQPAAPAQPGPAGRTDQLGGILAKGLDLAEASLSLGLTMLNRFGTVAQQQVFDRLSVAAAPHGRDAAEPVPAGAEAADAAQPPDLGMPDDPPPYCVTNRSPLTPGGVVRVSFSINNDSVTTPKKVTLRLEGFVGETEARRLDGGLFRVRPAARTIAPTDFEKFVLEGKLPPGVPPDTYAGSIVVSSGDEFRIPVRLVVMTS